MIKKSSTILTECSDSIFGCISRTLFVLSFLVAFSGCDKILTDRSTKSMVFSLDARFHQLTLESGAWSKCSPEDREHMFNALLGNGDVRILDFWENGRRNVGKFVLNKKRSAWSGDNADEPIVVMQPQDGCETCYALFPSRNGWDLKVDMVGSNEFKRIESMWTRDSKRKLCL